MRSAFERRVCNAFWIGYAGENKFKTLMLPKMFLVEVLGYYMVLPLPRRLTNKIEFAVAKHRFTKWAREYANN